MNMMTGKQKLFYLLSRISDKRELTEYGKSIQIHPVGDLEGNFAESELKTVLIKLQDEDNILRIGRLPEGDIKLDYEDECFSVKLLPSFDGHLESLRKSLEEKTSGTPTKKLTYSFDSERGILTVKGVEIQFNNDGRRIPYLDYLTKGDDYAHHSEVAEELEGAEQIREAKDTYYELCRGIQDRLLKYGITDFLEFDYNRARINPLYKKIAK